MYKLLDFYTEEAVRKYCETNEPNGHRVVGFSAVNNPDPNMRADPIIFYLLVDIPPRNTHEGGLVSVMGSHIGAVFDGKTHRYGMDR